MTTTSETRPLSVQPSDLFELQRLGPAQAAILPQRLEDISVLSWAGLSSLAATLLVDELAPASQHGGKAV